MTSSQTPNLLEPRAAAAHAPLFSEPEVVKTIVVPDLDPAKAVPVFSNPL